MSHLDIDDVAAAFSAALQRVTAEAGCLHAAEIGEQLGPLLVQLIEEIERLRQLWPANGFSQDTDVRQLIANHRQWTERAQRATDTLANSSLSENLRRQRATIADLEQRNSKLERERDGWASRAIHAEELAKAGGMSESLRRQRDEAEDALAASMGRETELRQKYDLLQREVGLLAAQRDAARADLGEAEKRMRNARRRTMDELQAVVDYLIESQNKVRWRQYESGRRADALVELEDAARWVRARREELAGI